MVLLFYTTAIMPEHTAIAPLGADESYFFVYGTLRKGDHNDITQLMPAPRFIGPARIKGGMAHLGRYPGVTLGGSGDIVGEVYVVSRELEQCIDAIESEYPVHADEYAKREITVVVQGHNLLCYVYEINPVYVVGKPVIASGDWVKDR